MKRIVVLFLIAAFIISVSGCAAKSEYDKLLDEKASVQKKCDDLLSKNVQLRLTISTRGMEIKDLKSELKSREAEVRDLRKDLTKVNAKIKVEAKTE